MAHLVLSFLGATLATARVGITRQQATEQDLGLEQMPLLVPRAQPGMPPPWPHPPEAAWQGALQAFSFGGWPPRDQWENLFANSVSGATGDPCSASILGNSRLSPNGLGSRMNTFADEVLVGMYAGAPISLCAPTGVRDDWAIFFEDPGFKRCSAPSCVFTSTNGSKPALLAWMVGRYVSETEDDSSVEAIKRFLYPRLFNFRSEIKEAALDQMSQLGLAGMPYVGVHIRRGDKAEEVNGFVPTKVFAQHIVDLCTEVSCAGRVFLASDSAEELPKLQAALGQSYRVVELPRLAEDMYTTRGSGSPEAASRQIISDLLLLREASAFVGTSSSNIGRLVYFLREPNSPSVSLDDAGNFLWRGAL